MSAYSPSRCLSTLAVCAALAMPAMAQEVTDDTDARIAAFLADVGRDRMALDRSGFDPGALIDRLDHDADPIVAFVTNEIAFEPYPGVLRGAEGTLMSRAGNSVDTAILLAHLLGDAGYEVRIARGTLEDDDARRLIGSMRADGTGDDAAAIGGSALFGFARDRSEALIADLSAAGLSLPAPDLPARIVEETRDYAWVEYRLGAMEDWRAVHPHFPDAPNVDARDHFAQVVPEELLHSVGVSLMLEQRIAGGTRKQRIAGPYVRPAANLNGQLVELFIQPNTFGLETTGQGALDSLRRAGIFVPVIAGEVSSIAFDRQGNTIDTDALSLDAFGAAAVFQNVGEATRDAADALAAMGSDDSEGDDSVMALTGLWLELAITAPGGRQQVWRRDLIAPLPAGLDDADARLARAAQITAHHGVMVSTSGLPEAYAADRALSRMQDTAPLWPAFLSSLDGEARDVDLRDWPGTSPLPHLGTFRLMEQGVSAMGGLRSYRPGPAVMIVRQALGPTGTSQHSVDIVANPRRSWAVGADGPVIDREATLRAGVWETAAEGHFDPQSSAESERLNTFAVIGAARRDGIGLGLAERSDDAEALSEPAARRALRQDMEAGHVALLPEARPEGIAMTGWWRVHPETGETLGMLADGRGSEATEYLIDNTLLAYNLIKSIKSYSDCDQYGGADRMCCLVEAHMNNVGGLGMSGVLGATYGSGTARMCDIGGIVQDAIETPGEGGNAYQCKIFAPGFDPDSLTGPGGVYDPELLGCVSPPQPE